jgi:hypothetical protein
MTRRSKQWARDTSGLHANAQRKALATEQRAEAALALLIPTCVLRETSKMGEVGHRTEALGIGFQLIESVTDLINHLIERSKSEIRQVFFAHFFPHMFHVDSRSGL